MPKNLTYRQLADIINNLPEDNKDDNVTICMGGDDFNPVSKTDIADDAESPAAGVLDPGHLYLVLA